MRRRSFTSAPDGGWCTPFRRSIVSHAAVSEPILDPDLPIVDPHHHLWDRRALLQTLPPPQHPFEQVLRLSPRYLLDELLNDLKRGHNVVATVFVECGSMYRSGGPTEMKPVGETEFVNGVAAMSASGTYGVERACAGIVGHADLTRGAAAKAVLEAHLLAGGGRFRGVRQSASWDADPSVLGPLARAPEGLYRSAAFREGFAELEPLGLSFDAWMLEPQLDDLIDLANAFAQTTIILDLAGAHRNARRLPECVGQAWGPRHAVRRLRYWDGRGADVCAAGADVGTLHRILHHRLRRSPLHVRE
jgi:L-fuconolactonase